MDRTTRRSARESGNFTPMTNLLKGCLVTVVFVAVLVECTLVFDDQGKGREAGGWPRPAESEVGSEPVELTLSQLRPRINGKGPFRFGFDTGQSPAALVSQELVERLNLPVVSQVTLGDGSRQNSSKVDVVRVETIELGGAVFRGIDAVVWSGEGDGSLGYSLFGHCLLTVDVGSNRLRLAHGELPEPDGQEVLPLKHDHGTPCVDVEMGQRTIPLVIDSGFGQAFFALPSHYAEELPLVRDPVAVGQATTLFNPFEIKAARLEGIARIGPHEIENPDIFFNEHLAFAILGKRCLRRFIVTFDAAHSRVRFERREARERDR